MIVKTTPVGDYRITPLGSLQVEDVKVIVYKNGKFYIQYLYKDLLPHLIHNMQRNISNDFDNVAVIDGIEGSGKSSWTWAAINLQTHHPDVQGEFSFERQLTYSPTDLREKLKNGDDRHGIFWLDEAYDIANKREWMSQHNQVMVKNLVKMRSRLWTLYMDVPRMEDMDIYIRDHRARYWITCEYGMTFDETGYHERGIFHLRVRDKKTKRWVECGYGLFPDMPHDVKKEYLAYKNKSQDDSLTGEDERKEAAGAKYKAKYESERRRLAKTVQMLRNSGVSVGAICDSLKLTRDQYNHLMKLAKDFDRVDLEDDDDA